MNLQRFARHAATAAVAAGLFAASVPDAAATHFRYATMKWEITRDSNGTVDLKVTTESAWRRSFYSPLPLPGVPVNTGQVIALQDISTGETLEFQNLVITPTSINPGEDWFVGGSDHIFLNVDKTKLPARVYWFGNARISTLMDNNNDRSFRVEAVIPNDTTNLFSPSASILPIINVAYPLADASFLLPAADADGDALTWSIAPVDRSALVKAAPDGADNLPPATLRIDATTGLVHWATNEEVAPTVGQELYAVQFLVRDARGGEIPVDALLRLVPNAGLPPIAKINGSETPYSTEVNPGTPVSFTFCGEDADFGATVTLTSGGLPPGASMTPTLPFSGTPPRCSVFNWTPTVTQAGSHVVAFAVTDNFAQQDTISATIIVRDNFQPDITCPAPVTLEATGPGGASHTAQSTVSDPDGDDVEVRWLVNGTLEETDNVPNGTSTIVTFARTYAIGTHALRIEARDGITAARVCDTSVTVVDTTGPVLSLPPSQVLEATGPGGAVATWPPPTAVDLVDGTLPVTCNHASGETFPLGVTTVACSATDAHNNTTTGSFTITVQDTTPPVLHLPANMTVPATGPGGAVVNYVVTATDIVDQNPTIACVPPSGSNFPIGTTTVLCTATDDFNNSSSGSFTITVRDVTPPPVVVTLGPGVLWPPNHKMVRINVTVQTEPGATCAITNVTSNEPVDGRGDGNTPAFDWLFGPGLNLQLRAERDGRAPGRIYTVTVSCTDAAGNVGTGTATAICPHDMGGSTGPSLIVGKR